jgi:hypothetical protein
MINKLRNDDKAKEACVNFVGLKWLAKRPQLPRTHENCDIIDRAVQELRNLPRRKPRRNILRRPGRQCRWCHLSKNSFILLPGA